MGVGKEGRSGGQEGHSVGPYVYGPGCFGGVITSLSYFQQNARIIKYGYTPRIFPLYARKKSSLKIITDW